MYLGHRDRCCGDCTKCEENGVGDGSDDDDGFDDDVEGSGGDTGPPAPTEGWVTASKDDAGPDTDQGAPNGNEAVPCIDETVLAADEAASRMDEPAPIMDDEASQTDELPDVDEDAADTDGPPLSVNMAGPATKEPAASKRKQTTSERMDEISGNPNDRI